MKITCKTNSNHNRFRVNVWMSEDWIVDRDGNFIKVFSKEREPIKRPSPNSDFDCITCGEWVEGK